MSAILALDIAILPPLDVSQRAIELSAQLPKDESQGLLLSPDYLPHITLLQQFVDENQLPTLLERVEAVTRRHVPIRLRVTGGAMGSSSVWMEIEPTAALHELHMQILDAAAASDRGAGDRHAFLNGEGRDRDVRWVTGYRTASSGARFRPHITLGHAAHPPSIEPCTFEASTIAACHLGRFCSCRRVLRAWTLNASTAR